MRAFFAMAPVHLAIAQFRPSKGDVALNTTRIGEILAQATELTPTPHVVQFAETVLSGYFVEGAVRETATTPDALATSLAEAYHVAGGRTAIDAVVGFYETLGGTLHNSAA
ncbi:MAG: NAD+ synthase, partial [Gemmatimonadota bacterium]|nr:NAD+ synthase [Gemmatimonadota bacterium]